MSKYRKIIYPALAIFLIILDQMTKYIIRHSGGFYICNRGVAFGISPLWIVLILATIIILPFIFQISNSPNCLISNKNPNAKCPIKKLDIRHFIRNWELGIRNCINLSLPLSLILAGGISNLIDRLHYGCVTDFIDVHFWPVFNVADIYISIGGIIVLYALLIEQKR